MSDITLPMKGGWILLTKTPPTNIKPPVLGIFYAKPERIFERGSLEINSFFSRTAITDTELFLLYKHRAGARLKPDDLRNLANAHNRITGKRGEKMEVQPVYFEFEEPEETEPEEPTTPVCYLEDIELEMRVRIVTPDGEVCIEPHEYSIIQDVSPYIDCIGNEYQMRELGGLDKAKKLKEQLFYVMSRGIPKVEAYKLLLGQIERPNVFWLEPHPQLASYFGMAA